MFITAFIAVIHAKIAAKITAMNFAEIAYVDGHRNISEPAVSATVFEQLIHESLEICVDEE